ncbi:MAG: hypothetical protein R3D55_23535 [Chloroflexota bacterium]
MSYMAQRVAGFGTTIFTEMTALANAHLRRLIWDRVSPILRPRHL